MSPATIAALGTFLGILVTLIFGYFTSKGKNKTDSSISHRQSLSTDEQTFRKDLLTEVDSYREKIQSMMKQFDTLSIENAELKVVNIEVRGMNTQLRALNVELLAKVATMQLCIDNNTSRTSSSVTSTETHTTNNKPVQGNQVVVSTPT